MMRAVLLPGLTVTLLAGLAMADMASAQSRTHVVIVVGLGGTATYREAFHDQATRARRALVERHGVDAQDVVYLGERVELDPDVIDDRSTRDNVLAALARISGETDASDRALVLLFGHGTSGASGAAFNLPGPDITPAELGAAFDAFGSRTVALVHTGSGSGAYLEPVSGPNRVVVTATRSARELNATRFGEHFVRALEGDDADIDRDGTVSLLEAYTYARQEVARHYASENQILTENAVLDDDGDGQGTHEARAESGDGALAAAFHLGGHATTTVPDTDDPQLQRLYRERNELQTRIDELRALRGSIDEERYLDEMEGLLVELALKNREIRAAEGGRA